MIEHGHEHRAIMGYTLSQLQIFLRAVGRVERQRQAERIVSTRLAVSLGDLTQVLEDLTH